MAPAARTRTTSNRVATSIGCAPLKSAYELAVTQTPKSWEQVEDGFLRAMEALGAPARICVVATQALPT